MIRKLLIQPVSVFKKIVCVVLSLMMIQVQTGLGDYNPYNTSNPPVPLSTESGTAKDGTPMGLTRFFVNEYGDAVAGVDMTNGGIMTVFAALLGKDLVVAYTCAAVDGATVKMSDFSYNAKGDIDRITDCTSGKYIEYGTDTASGQWRALNDKDAEGNIIGKYFYREDGTLKMKKDYTINLSEKNLKTKTVVDQQEQKDENGVVIQEKKTHEVEYYELTNSVYGMKYDKKTGEITQLPAFSSEYLLTQKDGDVYLNTSTTYYDANGNPSQKEANFMLVPQSLRTNDKDDTKMEWRKASDVMADTKRYEAYYSYIQPPPEQGLPKQGDHGGIVVEEFNFEKNKNGDWQLKDSTSYSLNTREISMVHIEHVTKCGKTTEKNRVTIKAVSYFRAEHTTYKNGKMNEIWESGGTDAKGQPIKITVASVADGTIVYRSNGTLESITKTQHTEWQGLMNGGKHNTLDTAQGNTPSLNLVPGSTRISGYFPDYDESKFKCESTITTTTRFDERGRVLSVNVSGFQDMIMNLNEDRWVVKGDDAMQKNRVNVDEKYIYTYNDSLNSLVNSENGGVVNPLGLVSVQHYSHTTNEPLKKDFHLNSGCVKMPTKTITITIDKSSLAVDNYSLGDLFETVTKWSVDNSTTKIENRHHKDDVEAENMQLAAAILKPIGMVLTALWEVPVVGWALAIIGIAITIAAVILESVALTKSAGNKTFNTGGDDPNIDKNVNREFKMDQMAPAIDPPSKANVPIILQ